MAFVDFLGGVEELDEVALQVVRERDQVLPYTCTPASVPVYSRVSTPVIPRPYKRQYQRAPNTVQSRYEHRLEHAYGARRSR